MGGFWRSLVVAVVAAGAGVAPAGAQRPAGDGVEKAATVLPARPVPERVVPPPGYRRAVARGTRTATGEPGPAYWQQRADYTFSARLDPEAKTLEGTGEIRYHNRSPDTLHVLYLQLVQNYHAPGTPRLEEAEITGGVTLQRVAFNGRDLPAVGRPRYQVEGTTLAVVPPRPVHPGETVTLALEWSFRIPEDGISGRMGHDSGDLFFLAYWYPQMAVYDDVVGWQTDPFLGNSEFYAGFGDYDLTIETPAGWLVNATGELTNAPEVLAPEVLERLRRAEESDSVVRVVAAEEAERATRPGAGGVLRWRFRAESVRDVAFSATRRSNWDAVRTPVGDRDGDGTVDYARVDALYRTTAPRWKNAASYARHAIDFLSRYTGVPYPWPHMTAVEGGGIIGGGMEYPMMTLIGDYNTRGDSALYYVTAHELAHMWVPMMVSTDERRYSWLDEGFTTFHENQARKEYFPGVNHDLGDQLSYIEEALSGGEGEMMRRSAYHYPGGAFTTASYSKPATVLVALRGVLGEETFEKARREFLRRWAFKHAYPWDLWSTFEDVAGRDLDWFWHTWYHETWTLDQAVAEVRPAPDGSAEVVVRDFGKAPMPVHLVATRGDGTAERIVVPVETWLRGATEATVTVPAGSPVVRVEIDPAGLFPDVDRRNNLWVPAGPTSEEAR